MGSLRKNTLRAHGVDAHVSVDKLSGLLLVSGFSLSGSPIGVPEAETLNAGFYEGKPVFSSAGPEPCCRFSLIRSKSCLLV